MLTRDEVLDLLEQRSWIKATDHNLWVELTTMPEDHDGYLEDLANRPDQIGNLEIHKIVDLKRGNFAIITLFEVSQPQAEKVYTYEYVSWKNGPLSGAKGLVLIADAEDRITHFVILRGSKFAVGGDAFDVVGGFASPDEKGVSGMLARFEEEFKEELGLSENLIVKKIHNLGRILPDAGMTNNHPQLFVAIIDASQAELIGELPNPDPWELSIGPTIMPVERMRDTVMANDDAYFHILVTRAVAQGILPASLLEPDN
ncbi:hypothetical protein KKH23_03825 [Patescibacteria group bacterium]|nr:hypothetical protein [Patescibacteria group bacterium]MBU0776911.1 hypothetical protein [Patescibacteria group bacterium]MBU0846294.1 hypothetical protein [Patescibacteria group bacterium]MBU0922558.1 hypothetical protein [Patescibacteria group bacterium]MBU1066552.1 hypothetical protein [Patescibacteria group bacterium]